MNRRLVIVSVISLLLTACNLPGFLSDPLIPAALQVSASEPSQVMLNDEPLGTTPVNKKAIKAGKYTVKITNDKGSWSNEVTLHGSTVTIINRVFTPGNSATTGEIISLEQGEGMYVYGAPIEANVIIDKQDAGKTPVYFQSLTEGSHEVSVQAPGYITKNLLVKITKGYKMRVNIDLASQGGGSMQPTATPQPATTPQATTKGTPRPTAKPTTTPRPSPTKKASPTALPNDGISRMRVTQTPTGWVRLRATASTGSQELGKVNTGEILEVVEEATGWRLVRTTTGLEGWASSQYLTPVR